MFCLDDTISGVDVLEQMIPWTNTQHCRQHIRTSVCVAAGYNHTMSMTEENDSLRRKYMQCHYYLSGEVRPGMEHMAAHYLKLMGETKYPKAVYAR